MTGENSMVVWVVQRCYAYAGCNVEAVFSTEEEANEWAKSESNRWEDMEVVPLEVDKIYE